MHTYLFVLSPPYCGSTVLWRLLGTSPVVSSHPDEGQIVGGVQDIMRDKPWDPTRKFPWEEIKAKWEQVWDLSKPILLEKSPPDIVRAFDIEKAFQPAYFVALIRDPYAFCEGRRRRHKTDIRLSAEFWAKCASYQMANIKGLKNIIHFRYEDFAEDPERVKAQILQFLPELRDLDVTKYFKARTVRGKGAHKIHNYNQEKIDQLSAGDIRDISAVLQEHDELMRFFGYQCLEPAAGHNLRRLKAMVSTSALAAMDKIKRATGRVLNSRR